MNSDLLVPYFARLHEYFGLWLVEPSSADKMWRMARSMDMATHFQQAAGGVENPLSFVDGKGGKKVAVVKAQGPLMKGQSSMGGTSTVAMRRAIRTAAGDTNVSAILLAIESPGGTVSGTQDLATDVAEANKKKPVFAHIDDLGASAAYWIASQAAQVYANAPTALVGSIGTVLHMEDTSARNEKEGVKEIAFASGPLKAFGGGLGITDAQAAHLQALVNSLQLEFGAAVKRGRGMSDSQLAEVSTGAVFTAPEAKRLGLINGIQPLDKTLSLLASA